MPDGRESRPHPAEPLCESLTFYERLGFENRSAAPEHRNYMILGRGSIELHFLGEPNAFAEWASPTSCYLGVADADVLHAEWTNAGIAAQALTTTDYGMREFTCLIRAGTFSESVRSSLPNALAWGEPAACTHQCSGIRFRVRFQVRPSTGQVRTPGIAHSRHAGAPASPLAGNFGVVSQANTPGGQSTL